MTRLDYIFILQKLSEIEPLNGMHLPSSSSEVTMVPVSSARRLTSEDAVKKALEIQLDIQVSCEIFVKFL